MRRAKIVATLGPATKSSSQIRELVQAGMNVARLNFSHGDHTSHARLIDRLRTVAGETGEPLAILQDLRGPKLRTGKLEGAQPVRLQKGRTVLLTPEDIPLSPEKVSIDYKHLSDDLDPGDRVLLDDGQIELQIKGQKDGALEAKVMVGGQLGARKGVNLPGVSLSVPAFTDKDLRDLKFGLEHEVDMIAMSFVRDETNIQALREKLSELAPDRDVPIIAKLECLEAIERLDEIIAASNGVMVARGDLGVEVSAERVPSLQKEIISAANAERRVVITATQMLESMIQNPRPTRAEASDVANAVFDGSDALMLSGETAIGDHPIEAVKTMHRIIEDAEEHVLQWGYKPFKPDTGTLDDAEATTQAARALAHERGAGAIAVFTRTGRTATLMSSVRPARPIWAFTPERATFNRLALAWGVTPHLIPLAHSVEEMISTVENALRTSGVLADGQQFVLVASLPVGARGPANFTYLHTMGSPIGDLPS